MTPRSMRDQNPKFHTVEPAYMRIMSSPLYPFGMTQILKTAHTTYGDWKGTTAGDLHQTIGHRNIYQVVGLSQDEWWIVGIDSHRTDLTKAGSLHVYAVNKTESGIDNWEALNLHGEANGSVPVTNFLVHGISPAELFAESFNQLQLQFRSRSLGHDLDVVAIDDLNYDKETDTVLPVPVVED